MKLGFMIKTLAVLLSACLFFVVAGCSGNVDDSSTLNKENGTASFVTSANITAETQTSKMYSSNDTDSSWSEADAKAIISLNGNSINIVGSSARANDTTLTITSGGLYIISGTLDNGQIQISAPSTDTVRIVLNGVTITNKTSATIYSLQAKKLILTLADNTENTITDAENYIYSNTAVDEPDAAIFARDDLTINGTGSLTINGNFKNGIGTKDNLLIVSGTYNITAENDAMRGRDSVAVMDGTLTLHAGNDGIRSNNDGDKTKGWILLENGTFDITAGNDGIQAETTLTIANGSYRLITGGGSTSVKKSAKDSFMGLKSKTKINILDGEFNIDSADDTIHSNENVNISGGKLSLASGDDGIHTAADLTISNGEIIITTCYEGLEASTITISGGDITITSTDDGINLAGGNSDEEEGRFGHDQFKVDASKNLLISGGTVTIYAGRDAIDSNGTAEMTGGIVNLTAAMLGEGETIDTNGSWTQSGGELMESGGNGIRFPR